MSSRGEYVIALVMAHPEIVTLMFLSLMICATVFASAFLMKRSTSLETMKKLPFSDELSNELPGESRP
jgi:Flp pilus assembly protein protease CpaA